MIKDEVFNKCTRCGKEFTDLKVSVELGLYVERLKDTGVWEEVPNMTQESREYLCPDCFNKLCDILAQMNLPQATGTLKHDAGVILPVEEKVASEPCKCAETKTEDTTSSIRHRHENYNSSYSDDDEIIELVITSKVMENGVEVPGPDDGKIVRMTKREWRAQQEADARRAEEEEASCDCNRTSDPDMLVDVCDDVIYG